MNLRSRARIKYNGREYAHPRDLPPNVRRAYEQALHGERGANARRVLRTFVGHKPQLDSDDTLAGDVCRLCDKILTVINNNGEVTLPGSVQSDFARKNKNRWTTLAFSAAATLILAGVIVFIRTR